MKDSVFALLLAMLMGFILLYAASIAMGAGGGNAAPLGPGALHGMPYYPYQDEFYSQEQEDELQAQRWFWQQWNLRNLQQQRNRLKQKSPRY